MTGREIYRKGSTRPAFQIQLKALRLKVGGFNLRMGNEIGEELKKAGIVK